MLSFKSKTGLKPPLDFFYWPYQSALFVAVLLCPCVSGLTLVLLNPDIPCFANSVDPDQLASELDLHCLPLSV